MKNNAVHNNTNNQICKFLQVVLTAWLIDLLFHMTQLINGNNTLRVPFEGRVLNYDVVRKILYKRIIIFSPKMNIYARNTMRGTLKREVRGNFLACLRLNTTAYNPGNDLI